LDELYRKAVERHLISDVPVGLLLSGGVDSGLLLGMMNLYGGSWPTYTVGYGTAFEDDELEQARETARILSSNHVPVQIDRATFEAALPRVIYCLEEPVATSSIVPMYFVCERARQDVKVALIGQGPDELFGGYRRHIGVRYGSMWRRLPASVRRALAKRVQALPRNEMLKRGVYSLDVPDRLRRYQHVFSLVPGNRVDGLFRDGILPEGAGDGILDGWSDLEPLMSELDELGGFQFIEVRCSLPDELLMFADKLSMAHGLEVRVPYLDREVVEYVEQLPSKFKVRCGSGKWLHRKVCQDFLPKEILQRKKQGFAANIVDQWFSGTMTGRMRDVFLDEESLMYRILRPEAVRCLLNEHSAGAYDHHKTLFCILAFEEWLRATWDPSGAVS
jgi:asparagine synthase (glutamine-hydrolysing)